MSTSSSSAAPPPLSGHKRAAAAAAVTPTASEVEGSYCTSTAAPAAAATPSAADTPAAKRSKHSHASANGASVDTAADAAVRSAVDASQALRSGGQAVSPTHLRAAPSAPRAHLLSVPDAVLLHQIADAFLLDSESVRCAHTCRTTLHALRSYKLKSRVTIDEALKFADGSSVADTVVRAAEAAAEKSKQKNFS